MSSDLRAPFSKAEAIRDRLLVVAFCVAMLSLFHPPYWPVAKVVIQSAAKAAPTFMSSNMPVAGFEEDSLNPQALNPINNSSPSLAQIEDALDQLLTRLLREQDKERKKRLASGQSPTLRVISAAEMAAMPLKSDEEAWRETIIERPITGALELAIHEIGEVLFLRGGTDLMRDVLERVASRHPKSYGHRASILDHTWEGVGNEWWP